MSFILDALRKSDARRKQGNVPDIHTESSGPPPRRRRRLVLWSLVTLVAGLIAVAGIVLALRGGLPGFLSSQVADDEPVSDAGVETSPSDPVETADTDEASGSGEQSGRERAVVEETRAARRARAMRSEDAAAAPAPVQAESESGSETPNRARDRSQPRVASEDRRESSVLREASQRETEPVSAELAAEEIARRMAEARRRASDDVAESPDSPESPTADAQAGKSDAASARAPSSGQQAETSAQPGESDNRGVAGYVEQWDLPLSVRRNLPELVLNIHVYSQRPNERFVLINGERYVEGNSVGDDVELVEIRREGAVVDFRSHRFLLRRQ